MYVLAFHDIILASDNIRIPLETIMINELKQEELRYAKRST